MWRPAEGSVHHAAPGHDDASSPALTVRIGFLGGTFDPPHVGHLLVASDACDALALDRLRFIPNNRQPLKAGLEVASAPDRLAMLQALVGDDARFDVDAIEVDRGGTSYTVETLRLLKERYPDDERFLLLGADVGRTFPYWREPGEVARLAHLAIMRRADEAGEMDDVALVEAMVQVTGPEVPAPAIIRTRRIDVSSTEIRERVRTGRPIRGFVPEAVARLITERGLYQSRHA